MTDTIKEMQFKCTIIRCVYDSENFKVYATDVNREKYPQIKHTKYGTVSICGDVHELGVGLEYEVFATEENGKNGYSYRIKNIKRDKIGSVLDMQIFLNEILTSKQAQVLFETYPTIVEKVMADDLNDIDLNKLHGIKEYTFNLIKQKIISNYVLCEMVVEFKGLLSLSMLKKLYNKYTSVQVIRNKMRINPYNCLCNISGIGFQTADNLLLEIEKVSKENIANGEPSIIDFKDDLKTSSQRCMSCLFYLLEENENEGHTKMNIVRLKELCDKMVPACSHHFVNVIKDKNIHYNKDTKEVALLRTFKTEQYIAQCIANGLSIKNMWDIDVEKYKTCGNGIELTKEQIGALSNLCEHTVSILNGPPGTGKSQTTAAIISLLDDIERSYSLFSPTGRAAKILKTYTNRETSTIHRGLAFRPPDIWGYNVETQLDVDVLIIDEVSMCDVFLFKRVLDAINFTKTKLMLIGDNAQLPSVSCGNLLHDFMESNVIPTSTLSTVFRYGEGGLMKVATDVRETKKYLNPNVKSFITFGDRKDYMFIQSQSSQITNNIIALYKKLMTQNYTVEDIMVLTAQNKGEFGTIVLNNCLQKIANSNAINECADKIKIGEITYYVNDIVIQTKNNYKAKIATDDMFLSEGLEPPQTFIANGETGRILEIGRFDVIIDFDGEKVVYSRDDMQDVKLGYCVSTHKSQGGSFKIVILISPKSHMFMLSSNLIHVGLTRTIEKCYHIGNAEVVNKAIKKKENLKRNTFLKELLNAEAIKVG